MLEHDVGAGSPVGRLSVNRASMMGRGLCGSDGPRCCRFLASTPLAQKPAPDLPDRPEAGGGAYPRGNAPATLSKPSGAHLATKARYAPIGHRAGKRNNLSRPMSKRASLACGEGAAMVAAAKGLHMYRIGPHQQSSRRCERHYPALGVVLRLSKIDCQTATKSENASLAKIGVFS